MQNNNTVCKVSSQYGAGAEMRKTVGRLLVVESIEACVDETMAKMRFLKAHFQPPIGSS